MLNKNYPTITYISWGGLVLAKNNEKYIIEDGETNKKYVYWRTENPTVLYDSDDWMNDTDSRYMIYINDNGNGVEVAQEEITLYYTDIKNDSSISGAIAGKFDEIEGKYYTISQDVEALKQTVGSEVTEGDTIINKVNKIEQTAEQTKEEISKIQQIFEDNEELEMLRNGLTDSLLGVVNQLALYNNTIIDASKDLTVMPEEREEILQYLENERDFCFSMVVIDEVHYFKNVKRDIDLKNPTIVLITDRTDLDDLFMKYVDTLIELFS